MKLLVVIFCLFQFSLALGQSKEEVLKVIDAMKITGQFSAEDIARAKQQLMQLT